MSELLIPKPQLLLEYDAGYVVDSKELTILREDTTDNVINGIPYFVYAVLQKAGVKNINQRIYSEPLLRKAIEQYKKQIALNSSQGELNHPESATLDLSNIAFKIVDIWWEGITVMGKLKLHLSKPFIERGEIHTAGDMMANLIMDEHRVGISSRGVGTLKKVNGQNIVQDDYALICWDAVHQPSSHGSWISPNLKDLSPYIQKESNNEPAIITQNNVKLQTPLKNNLSAFLSRYKK